MKTLKVLLLIAVASQIVLGSAWSETPADSRSALSRRAQQSSESFYDEIFDSRGKIRPQYEDIWAIYSRIDRSVLENFRDVSARDFQRDNALAALPKILTQSEFDELNKGVKQRALASLLFLQDHYSGSKKYLEAKIIPTKVMDAIMTRSGEAIYQEYLKPLANGLSFPYGSDLIRGADGKFYEIEFNSGFVGGFGDIRLARRILFERIPEYKQLLHDTPEPEQFYKNLLERYKLALKQPNDLIVFLTVPPYSDKEDDRLIKIWQDLGVHHIKSGDTQKIINQEDGLFLEVSRQRAESLGWDTNLYPVNDNVVRRKIGFAIVNSEHSYADNSHPATAQRYWLQEANYALEETFSEIQKQKIRSALIEDPATGKVNIQNLIDVLRPDESLLHSGFPGLMDAIISGKVAANYTPGAELLSDKELHTYFEDIIRFYLKEEPIIKNLPTQRFYMTNARGKKILNQALLDDTMANLDQYVVKIVDGRGGVGVWVGSKVPPAEKIKLAELIAAHPEQYIRQKFMHLSTMDQDITDIRMLAQVGPLKNGVNTVEVSEVPWGRALPINGNGKVNLSGNGHEVTVFVRKDGSYPKRPSVKSLLGRSCPILFNEVLSRSY